MSDLHRKNTEQTILFLIKEIHSLIIDNSPNALLFDHLYVCLYKFAREYFFSNVITLPKVAMYQYLNIEDPIDIEHRVSYKFHRLLYALLLAYFKDPNTFQRIIIQGLFYISDHSESSYQGQVKFGEELESGYHERWSPSILNGIMLSFVPDA